MHTDRSLTRIHWCKGCTGTQTARRERERETRADGMVLPTRKARAASAEPAERKLAAKAVRIGATAKVAGEHSSLHKHPRRSHRPIIAKGRKAARLQAESNAKVVAETTSRLKLHAGRLKVLRKLLARQEGAGKSADAAATKAQIETVNEEMRVLEMDLVAMGTDGDGGGGASADAPGE